MSGCARRVAWAAVVAVVAAAGLVVVLGLVFGAPRGAADNGDGFRLFCGAGLVPGTPSHAASWQGGVVLDFVRGTPCADAQPSSAGVFLKAVAGGDGVFSLTTLAWFYVVLVFVVTVLAGWAVQARGRRFLLGLLPPLVPLLEPDFARMFLSTFAEPAGLLGAYMVLCGVAVIAVTRVGDGFERLVALGLVAAGGVVAGLAKIGCLPVFALAVLVCAATGARMGAGRWWSARLVGPVLAVLLVLEIVAPVRDALGWQNRHFGEANADNVVYTLGLVEMPGTAGTLGLPADAQTSAGRAFFPQGAAGLVGSGVVARDPNGVKQQVWGELLAHPGALARVVGIGLQSTYGRDLPYLVSAPWTPASTPPVAADLGADPELFQRWLDDMSLPWWPSLLVLSGLAAGVVAAVRRRHGMTRYGLVAAFSALGALGIAVMAVLGDGFYEIAKHVWLAAYLLDVTVLSLCAMAPPSLVRWLRRLPLGADRRREPSQRRRVVEPGQAGVEQPGGAVHVGGNSVADLFGRPFPVEAPAQRAELDTPQPE